MVRLVFDCSTPLLMIAVLKGEVVLADFAFPLPQRHAGQLIPQIEQCLHQAGANPQDVAEVYVGRGPGSFTGVRIALMSAKVFAYALNIPLYTFPSLGLFLPPQPGNYCIIMPTRNERCYFATFSNGQLVAPVQAATLDQINQQVMGMEKIIIDPTLPCNQAGFTHALTLAQREDPLTAAPEYL